MFNVSIFIMIFSLGLFFLLFNCSFCKAFFEREYVQFKQFQFELEFHLLKRISLPHPPNVRSAIDVEDFVNGSITTNLQ